ncbi:MAG: metal-dependent phosphohydrolase, partial [Candidatus Latescibacteria bacterium]|nr:metal-dependent phosphohydrolase [Candidatus Latescibacterota bacterium]
MKATDLKAQVDNLIRIGIALSSERNIDVLLEMIVDESRRFTQADAGTLFIVSDDGKALNWKIVQNDTMGTRIGGTSSVEIDDSVFPPVPLVVEGQINHANVSA